MLIQEIKQNTYKTLIPKIGAKKKKRVKNRWNKQCQGGKTFPLKFNGGGW